MRQPYLSEKTMQLNPSALRLGTETAFSVLARAGQLAREGRDIINLGIGQPDFPTPPHIVEAAVKALRDGAPWLYPCPWAAGFARSRGRGFDQPLRPAG